MPADGSGGGEGAWNRRAAPRARARRRWLFTPVVDEREVASFQALECAHSAGDSAPRVHAEVASMALAYACASGWKSSSSMIDEAEGRDWEKPRSKRRWRGFPWCASRLFGVMRDADYGYTTDTRAAYRASRNPPPRMLVLLACPAVAPRGPRRVR